MTEIKSELMQAIDWIDNFIARCNGDDRGSCDSVNLVRAALAKVKLGEPVAWQYRAKLGQLGHWSEWLDCSETAFGDYTKVPQTTDWWHYEARALFTHPVRAMSDEPRYTVDQIADAACHAEVNDSKFESMCVYLGGIKGATA